MKKLKQILDYELRATFKTYPSLKGIINECVRAWLQQKHKTGAMGLIQKGYQREFNSALDELLEELEQK